MSVGGHGMNRTLKIFLIVGLSGLLLLILILVLFYRFVSERKDDWLTKGRETLQEGIAAGNTLTDAQCLDKALAMHRDGQAGIGGIGAKLWLKGCFQSATPTDIFCSGIPAQENIAGSVRWQFEICAKHGLSTQSSTCTGTVGEAQVYCQTRGEAR
jgi:hypothetical protein